MDPGRADVKLGIREEIWGRDACPNGGTVEMMVEKRRRLKEGEKFVKIEFGALLRLDLIYSSQSVIVTKDG